MCPFRAGMFLNLRLQIVHSTGRSRSGAATGAIVEAALPPPVFAETADEILGFDDLIGNEA